VKLKARFSIAAAILAAATGWTSGIWAASFTNPAEKGYWRSGYDLSNDVDVLAVNSRGEVVVAYETGGQLGIRILTPDLADHFSRSIGNIVPGHWVKPMGIAVTDDAIYICGNAPMTMQDTCAFLVKLDYDGNMKWNRNFPVFWDDKKYGYSALGLDPVDGTLWAVVSQTSSYARIDHLRDAGDHCEEINKRPANHQGMTTFGYSVAVTADAVIVGGSVWNTANWAAWLAKYDKSFNQKWTQKFDMFGTGGPTDSNAVISIATRGDLLYTLVMSAITMPILKTEIYIHKHFNSGELDGGKTRKPVSYSNPASLMWPDTIRGGRLALHPSIPILFAAVGGPGVGNNQALMQFDPELNAPTWVSNGFPGAAAVMYGVAVTPGILDFNTYSLLRVVGSFGPPTTYGVEVVRHLFTNADKQDVKLIVAPNILDYSKPMATVTVSVRGDPGTVVRIRVYDMAGQDLTFFDVQMGTSGTGSFTWKGWRTTGRMEGGYLPPGTYWLRDESGKMEPKALRITRGKK